MNDINHMSQNNNYVYYGEWYERICIKIIKGQQLNSKNTSKIGRKK